MCRRKEVELFNLQVPLQGPLVAHPVLAYPVPGRDRVLALDGHGLADVPQHLLWEGQPVLGKLALLDGSPDNDWDHVSSVIKEIHYTPKIMT